MNQYGSGSMSDGVPSEWQTNDFSDDLFSTFQDDLGDFDQNFSDGSAVIPEPEPAPELPAKREKRGWLRKREQQPAVIMDEDTKVIYQKERKANQRDYILLGVLAVLVVAGIGLLFFFLSDSSNEEFYELLDQRKFGVAYSQLEQWHESGKNMDAQVRDYTAACLENSEYRRAVTAQEFLSQAALDDETYYMNMVRVLLYHDQAKRANDLLHFLRKQGGAIEAMAERIYQAYESQL